MQVVPGTDADLAVAEVFEAHFGVWSRSSLVVGELEAVAVTTWATSCASVFGRVGEEHPVPPDVHQHLGPLIFSPQEMPAGS